MSHKSQVTSRKLDCEGRRAKGEGRLFIFPASPAGRHHLSSIIYRMLFLFSILCLLSSTIGCEAFVRKFTRKPKKENLPHEEVIVAPQEYNKAQLPKEELSRQYFLFWKGWQDELIGALSESANHKRQVSCANQAIKNLEELSGLLIDDRKKQLGVFISQLQALRDSIVTDLYGINVSASRSKAERIKSGILREFSYTKIAKYLL